MEVRKHDGSWKKYDNYKKKKKTETKGSFVRLGEKESSNLNVFTCAYIYEFPRPLSVCQNDGKLFLCVSRIL